MNTHVNFQHHIEVTLLVWVLVNGHPFIAKDNAVSVFDDLALWAGYVYATTIEVGYQYT